MSAAAMADNGDLAMAVLGWSSSWICGGEDDGGLLTLASPCVQRTLIDCVNVVLLVAYDSTLAAAACVVRPRRRQCAAAAATSRRRIHRRWVLLVVPTCCVAAAVAYGVTGLQQQDASVDLVPCLVSGLVWIALAASLHVQPTRPARAVAVLWWALFSLLVAAYNAEILAGGHSLGLAETIAWPVSLLLLHCALGSLLHLLPPPPTQSRPNDGSSGLQSEPLIGNDDDRTTAGLYRAGLLGQLAFSWLNPLLRLGRSKALGLDDIPLIADEDTAHHAWRKFNEAWSRHRHVSNRSRQSVGSSSSSNSLALVLCECFLGEILLTGFYALMRTLCTAVAPCCSTRPLSAACCSPSSSSRCRSGTGSSAPGELGCVSGQRSWRPSSGSSSGCPVRGGAATPPAISSTTLRSTRTGSATPSAGCTWDGARCFQGGSRIFIH